MVLVFFRHLTSEISEIYEMGGEYILPPIYAGLHPRALRDSMKPTDSKVGYVLTTICINDDSRIALIFQGCNRLTRLVVILSLEIDPSRSSQIQGALSGTFENKNSNWSLEIAKSDGTCVDWSQVIRVSLSLEIYSVDPLGFSNISLELQINPLRSRD